MSREEWKLSPGDLSQTHRTWRGRCWRGGRDAVSPSTQRRQHSGKTTHKNDDFPTLGRPGGDEKERETSATENPLDVCVRRPKVRGLTDDTDLQVVSGTTEDRLLLSSGGLLGRHCMCGNTCVRRGRRERETADRRRGKGEQRQGSSAAQLTFGLGLFRGEGDRDGGGEGASERAGSGC